MFARHLAPLRAEPRDDAERVTEALPGEPLEVEEERDGWARVRTAYGYPGWVRVGGALGRGGRLVARTEREPTPSTTHARCWGRRTSGAA